MQKHFFYITILSILGMFYSTAQDIHFSQYYASPVNLCPAQTGLFRGDYRLTGNYRDQWRSVTVPYKTFAASFDARMKIIPDLYSGAGVQFNADKAGDGDFGTTQVKFSFAAHKILNDSMLVIAGGFNIAYNQNSINYEKLTFGSQFNGYQYDPNMDHQEVFMQNDMSYFDYTLGFHAYYLINEEIPVHAGICFHHLNTPQQSFYDNEAIELNGRYNIYAGSQILLSRNKYLLPTLFFMDQGRYKEFIPGARIKFLRNEIAFHTFYMGGFYRFKDAFIVQAGFDYLNTRVGLTYDINLSGLTVASNGLGGFEISVIYIFSKYQPIAVPEKRDCPSF